MIPPRVLLGTAVVAAVLLAGCSSGAKSAGPVKVGGTSTSLGVPGSTGQTVTLPPATTTSGASTTSRATTTTTRPIGSRATVVQLTASSEGPVNLKVGETVELTLATAGMKWSTIMVSPPGLLKADPSPTPPPNGQLVIWTAAAPGTVQVMSGGTAVCNPGTVCPLFVRLFKVTLVIS